MNYQEKLEELIAKIGLEQKTPRLLLHACCAPCSSYVLEYLSNYFEITILFYNPNMDSVEEYEKRLSELNLFVNAFSTRYPVQVIGESYEPESFSKRIKGLEDLPEGGKRCFECYYMRLEESAKYASLHHFDYFTTTLSISPYKNSRWINEIGALLEKEYPVSYLYADFKKKDGYKRSILLSNQYHLYRQDYCGCIYSKIANEMRKQIEINRNKNS